MDATFFATNRHRLIERLEGGSVVIGAYAAVQRGNDAAHMFEQEASFWWLCGIERPDWWLIIDGSRRRSVLVMPKLGDTQAIFDGSLDGQAAKKISGVDEVVSQTEGERLLHSMARTHSLVYTLGDDPYAEYYNFYLNPAPKKLHDTLVRTFTAVQDCRKELAALRAIKHPEEIKAIERAVALTCRTFDTVRDSFQSFASEYEIEAEFSYRFRRAGATGHAYEPIVAAGINACTLHYNDNSSGLKKRQLVLLDIGARLGGYAADITRTYAFGEPTKRQIAVHSAVQDAQQQIIALLEPGLPLGEYQRQVDEIMADALKRLGLLGEVNNQDNYRRYFPHAISHGLGIDVHDSLGAPRVFMPGMVVTVEPGIYIPEESLGVRIEDDILITDKGHKNLSGSLSTELL